MKKIITPFLFLILALIDAHITNILGNIFTGSIHAISALLIIAFIPATVFFNKRYLIITALILGLILDSYFVGIIGINATIFPVLAFFMYQFKDVLNVNVFTQLFGVIIFVTVDMILLAAIQVIFQLTSVDPIAFVIQLLGPTLIVNSILFFIIIFPVRKLFQVK
jgi:rod shape-determining protein MreD